MNRRINDREWQELSAHLDGQLSVNEAARLDKKLQESPELRAAYDELNRVRSLLRSQPRLRAPRNFTISAQMAGVQSSRRSRPLSPLFGFVSALASVMLVLLLAGEFFLGSSPTAPVPAAMEVQSEAVVMEAPLQLESGEEPSSKEIPVQETAGAALRSYPAPELSENGVMAAQAPEESPAYPSPEQALQVDQESEELGNAADVDLAAVDEQAVSPEQSPESRQIVNGWRIAQALLLVVAVSCALAAFALRRKTSR